MYFMNVLMVLKLLAKNSVFRIRFLTVFIFLFLFYLTVFHIAFNKNLQTLPSADALCLQTDLRILTFYSIFKRILIK